MKHQLTREQVLDALQTHKTIYKAAYSLGVSSPTLSKWMKHYGIVANIYAIEKPVDTGHNDDEHAFRAAINKWYKRLFSHGKESN